MTKKHFLFQTPDERLAGLNDWAARDYASVKLVDGLAGDAEAQPTVGGRHRLSP